MSEDEHPAGAPAEESPARSRLAAALVRRADLRAARRIEQEERRQFAQELAHDKTAVRDIRRELMRMGIDTRDPLRTRKTRDVPPAARWPPSLPLFKGLKLLGGNQPVKDEEA